MTMNLKNQTVLVTGGGGFIGSRLCERLVQSGATVRAFVRYTSRAEIGLLRFLEPDILKKIEIIRGDLRDFSAVEQASRGVDIVFHLGALISIPYSYVHPVETVQTNLLGTLNILEACRKSGTKLVHTSTSEVYGTALRVPIDEDHPLQGQSPYSASKIGADKLVESYFRSFGLPTMTVRPFNTYGPGQSTRAVIPTIITQALAGGVVRLGNLDAIRDFTYLDDTVEGFLLTAQADTWNGETYNLGSGEEISIGAIAALIFRLMGKQAEIQLEKSRLRPEKSEVLRLISDNRKAKLELGWQPTVGMEEGLQRTIRWIGEHLDLYQPEEYGL
ncbi:MAG: GDP-mannose 4,6-dehydratase [Anaerolineaceae bacterium]|nr:GDP-mannose 4,6-dehydratase [Anaerolineaceae bacterium]